MAAGLGTSAGVQTVAAGVIGDRDVIVSGGDDGFGVWDAATGHVVGNQRPARPGRGLGVRAVAIGWSGYWNQNVLIVASHKGEIAVHEEIGGLRRRLDMLPGSRTQAATGAVRSSEAIVTSGHDGAWAWAWDAGTPRSIFPEVTASKKPEATHAVYVTPVAAGQIGGRDVIVSGSTDRKTCIWDVATSRLETLEMLDSVTGLAVSARYLAVASGIAVAVFLVPHSNQQLQPVARRGKM